MGSTDVNTTASVFLPFFDEGWWSIQVNVDENGDSPNVILSAANEINGEVGFYETSSLTTNTQYWSSADTSSFPHPTSVALDGIAYTPVTGSLQEIRYWRNHISESVFFDYVLSPFSVQGNTINSTPEELAFRARFRCFIRYR